MKKIIKTLTFLSILSFLSSCTVSNNQNNKYLSKLDKTFEGKDLEEAKKEVAELLSTFKPFVSFHKTFDREAEHIDKEDEVYESEFVKDTVYINDAINQFNKEVIFLQSFNDYNNRIKFEFKNNSDKGLVPLAKHIKQKMTPHSIFYKNGVVKTKGFDDYEISDLGVNSRFGNMELIDSIRVLYKAKYVSVYDEVELSNNNKKQKYKGGEIVLKELTKNHIYFITSDTINSPIKIQAYNKEGKPLESVAYSYSGTEKVISEERTENLVTFLENVKDKLEDEDFSSIDDLKEYFKKNVSAFDYFKDNDNYFHRYLYFKGNVAKVKLFFADKTLEKETSFTAVNTTDFKENIMMPAQDSVLFFNNKLEKILSVKNTDQEQLNNNFYEDEDYYYHYDFSNSKIDTILVYSLETYKNGLASVQENTIDDDYKLVNSKNIKIKNKEYERLFERGNLLFGEREDVYYFISSLGLEKELKSVSRIKETNDDDVSIISNDERKYGLINNKGIIITPMIYSKIYDFKEGIACVENSKSYYGGINKKGKVVIPFKYNESFEFQNGLAPIELEYIKKVIDKKNKVIIGSTNNDKEPESVEVVGEGEKRVFLFKGKKYNAKGKILTVK